MVATLCQNQKNGKIKYCNDRGHFRFWGGHVKGID